MKDKLLSKEIIKGTLRTFAIQGAVLVIALPFLLVSLAIGMLPVALIGPIAYTFFGYKFIKPLPKNNWLLVLGLVIALCLLFGVSYTLGLVLGSDTALQVESSVFFFNHQAIMFVIVTVGYVEYFVNYTLLGNTAFMPRDFFGEDLAIMAFIAMFVPSVFIYLGLCLRVRQQRRKQ
ncbi:MAG: hypothetical protein FWC86_03845 [Coriobacteriia bacterium]|nr:hypothetical protein [Coriobacteriia bacterium]